MFLRKGNGKIIVNGRAARRVLRSRDLAHDRAPAAGADQDRPTSSTSSVTVEGGGITGQAGAIRLGIARALVEYDDTLKSELRKAGFMTRDAREVERKKVGLHKARRATQFSKR